VTTKPVTNPAQSRQASFSGTAFAAGPEQVTVAIIAWTGRHRRPGRRSDRDQACDQANKTSDWRDFGYERGLTIPNAKQGLCELDGV
jgi:hypothetical protein